MLKNLVKFSNYLSNLWTKISGIKQIVYLPKIFGIRSLFVPFCLVYHWIVDTNTNTAVTYLFVPCGRDCSESFFGHSRARVEVGTTTSGEAFFTESPSSSTSYPGCKAWTFRFGRWTRCQCYKTFFSSLTLRHYKQGFVHGKFFQGIAPKITNAPKMGFRRPHMGASLITWSTAQGPYSLYFIIGMLHCQRQTLLIGSICKLQR
jgi:hypothetical protein